MRPEQLNRTSYAHSPCFFFCSPRRFEETRVGGNFPADRDLPAVSGGPEKTESGRPYRPVTERTLPISNQIIFVSRSTLGKALEAGTSEFGGIAPAAAGLPLRGNAGYDTST